MGLVWCKKKQKCMHSFFTVLIFRELYGDALLSWCAQFRDVHPQCWRIQEGVFRVFLSEAAISFSVPPEWKSCLGQPSRRALIGRWRHWQVLLPHGHIEPRPRSPAAQGERPVGSLMCTAASFFEAAGCWVPGTKRWAGTGLSESGRGMNALSSLSQLSTLPLPLDPWAFMGTMKTHPLQLLCCWKKDYLVTLLLCGLSIFRIFKQSTWLVQFCRCVLSNGGIAVCERKCIVEKLLPIQFINGVVLEVGFYLPFSDIEAL